MHLVSERAGDILVRPIYWSIVQAKRRRLRQAIWQPHDWKIGIGPPCEYCGENVPPEKHTNDCAFVGGTCCAELLKQQLAQNVEARTDNRILALQTYALRLQSDGVQINHNGAIDLERILCAVDEDIHRVSKLFGMDILSSKEECNEPDS